MEQVEQVKSTVRDLLNAGEPDGPFVQTCKDEEIFKCPEFSNRIAQAGKRMYLGMLDNGGVLPGKTDCFEAGKFYTDGMSEKIKAIYFMCVYEACCEASIQFRINGKMNGKLRTAADDPKTQQEPLT
jgi:hypothetical protein